MNPLRFEATHIFASHNLHEPVLTPHAPPGVLYRHVVHILVRHLRAGDLGNKSKAIGDIGYSTLIMRIGSRSRVCPGIVLLCHHQQHQTQTYRTLFANSIHMLVPVPVKIHPRTSGRTIATILCGSYRRTHTYNGGVPRWVCHDWATRSGNLCA